MHSIVIDEMSVNSNPSHKLLHQTFITTDKINSK